MNAKEDDRPLDVIRRMMLSGEKERDLGAPEIHYLNLGLPLVSTNIGFECCSLTGRRKLKSELDFNDSELRKHATATWISLRDFMLTDMILYSVKIV